MKKGKVFFLSLLVLTMTLVGSSVGFSQAPGVVIVQGNISSNTTWTSNNVYVLRGAVFVTAGATLAIQPGTLVAGEFATNGTLVIAKDARINAVGTAAAPIVFTSDQPYGPPDWPSDDRFRADWGGLIINGNATINIPGGIAFGEGGTGEYGGTNDNDNSGSLVYVRVEYAGTEFSPDNELNGIAFQAVGRGTTVRYIQVHMNLDDGVEFFGGTVNVKYLLLTNIGDDSMDYTDGWRGKAQFVIVQQRADDADQGFEFDNNAENNNLLPRSSPTIYNCTLIGDNTPVWGGESDHGMLIREGTAGRINNCIVLNFREDGIRLDQAATIAQANAGNLVLGSVIVFGVGGVPFDSDAAPFVASGQWPNVVVMDPLIRDPNNWLAPDFRPMPNSPAVDGTVPVAPLPAGDSFFTPAPFVGALSPTASQDWTKMPANWTTSAQGFTNFFPGASQRFDGRVLPRHYDDDEIPRDTGTGTEIFEFPGLTVPVGPGGGSGAIGGGDGTAAGDASGDDAGTRAIGG